ncbi:DUF1653 domain-containing protein [Vagococcus elongatus]|uniref:DUF1653 domain-containing protein n=1 Tax=Vagococcus elongatus TaxID=180344 RepID=A0A430AW38_9ENTE|nr:DUF1653 domain-containing protein [Vagococcus elongatus]RSU12271.1 hypothetical protein CBF29_06635 [Vagococcus elongatus]
MARIGEPIVLSSEESRDFLKLNGGKVGESNTPIQRVANDFYKHYKGGIYEVVGASTHTETEEELVLYKDESGRLWSRPVEIFLDVDNFIPELRSQMSRFEKVWVSVIDTNFGYLGGRDSIYAGRGMSWSGGMLFTNFKHAKKYEHDERGIEEFQRDFDMHKEIGAVSRKIHKQREY